jgi:predicted dehydrogenase
MVRDPATGTDVVTSGMLRFGEAVASFTCSTRAEDDQRVDIYGATGRISIEIPFNIPPDRPTRISITAGGDPPVAPHTETISFDVADPYTVEANAFAVAVLTGEPLPVAAADAVANLRVMEALIASAEPA